MNFMIYLVFPINQFVFPVYCELAAVALRELFKMKVQKRSEENDLPLDLPEDDHIIVNDEVDLTQAHSETSKQLDSPPAGVETTTITKAHRSSLSLDANYERNKGKISINSKSQKKVHFVIELPM